MSLTPGRRLGGALAVTAIGAARIGAPPYNHLCMDGLPSAGLIAKGLADLARGEETVESLLVSIGAPKLRALGLEIPAHLENPERRLYVLLGQEHGDNAHGQYNALVRQLVSYERAKACARP